MRGRIRTAIAEFLCVLAMYGTVWGMLLLGHGLGLN